MRPHTADHSRSRPALDQLSPEAFVRLPAVMAATGLARSTIYDAVKLGRFPPPVKLTHQAAGWRVGQIREWLRDPIGWINRLLPAEAMVADQDPTAAQASN